MSNKAKLIIGIVLIIAMIPAMGAVYVKDNMHNNNYCAACHQEYFDTWENPDTDYALAHVHNQMGVSCQRCHQRTFGESIAEVGNYITGNYYYPLPTSEVSMDKCFACHGDYAEIIPPLATALTGEQRNPHDGHWGELECYECHFAHQDSVVYCDQCHEIYMDADALGWTNWGSK